MRLIEINMMGLPNRLPLIFKTVTSVMFFLIADVAPHSPHLRLTDSERRESRLPAKPSARLALCPTG